MKNDNPTLAKIQRILKRAEITRRGTKIVEILCDQKDVNTLRDLLWRLKWKQNDEIH